MKVLLKTKVKWFYSLILRTNDSFLISWTFFSTLTIDGNCLLLGIRDDNVTGNTKTRCLSLELDCRFHKTLGFLRIWDIDLVIISIWNHKNDISVRNNLVRYRHTRLDKIPDDHLDEFRYLDENEGTVPYFSCPFFNISDYHIK